MEEPEEPDRLMVQMAEFWDRLPEPVAAEPRAADVDAAGPSGESENEVML